MRSKISKSDLLLVVTALIWGLSFAAQRIGMEYIGPFAFNAVRFALGAAVLIPVRLIWKKSGKLLKKKILLQGITAGLVLFGGSSLQQIGIVYTTAGKAGFITGLYVILVPIFGIFIKQHTTKNTWIGAVLAVMGLFLLSITKEFTIAFGDLLVLSSAVFWAIHVILIGTFRKSTDALSLSIIQFLTCAVLSMISSLIFERTTLTMIEDALVPILYGGIMSVGLAYTLQVIAQRDAEPAHASIILSLEGVFAVLGGILILHETFLLREAFGSLLILGGIIISQRNKKRIIK